MKTNYELKKEIFNRMVDHGYKGRPESIEWQCQDESFTVDMIRKAEKAFAKWLGEEWEEEAQ